MVLFRYCLILCFLIGFRGHAQITQANTMKEVMKCFEGTDCHTLAVFDVDMVLIQSGDPAFQRPNIERYKEIARKISQTIPKDKKTLFLTLMLLDSDSILIEECTPYYLQQLCQRGIPSIALTANLTGQLGTIDNLELWKSARLYRLGIDFSCSAPVKENHIFVNLPSYRGNYSVYVNGILFANGEACPKGDVLVHFLQTNNLHPKQVVFVDDGEANLKSVESALHAYDPSIHYQGVLYRGAALYASQPLSESQFEAKWRAIAKSTLSLQ